MKIKTYFVLGTEFWRHSTTFHKSNKRTKKQAKKQRYKIQKKAWKFVGNKGANALAYQNTNGNIGISVVKNAMAGDGDWKDINWVTFKYRDLGFDLAFLLECNPPQNSVVISMFSGWYWKCYHMYCNEKDLLVEKVLLMYLSTDNNVCVFVCVCHCKQSNQSSILIFLISRF